MQFAINGSNQFARVWALFSICFFFPVVIANAVPSLVADLRPSVDTVPYYKVNLASDLIDSSGAGTQFVNFASNYPANLSSNNILVTDAAGDRVALRMRLDSAFNIRTAQLHDTAHATFRVSPPHLRHVTAIYISANCFNVTSKFIDSAVLIVDAYFSRGTATKVFRDTLLLDEHIRNFRLNTIGGLQTPIDPPADPNVQTLSDVGDRFLDLIKLPVDSSFTTFHVDSIRLRVPTRRTVFIIGGIASHVDGGTRIHAVSFATDYELGTANFQQGDPQWGSRLINNIAGKTMRSKGCAITSCAAMLNFLDIKDLNGNDITPGTLLDWLNANNGFSSGTSDLDFLAIQNFTEASFNANGDPEQIRLTGLVGRERNVDSIEQTLTQRLPFPIRVRSRKTVGGYHFVLARGVTKKIHPNHPDSLVGTYLIEDPDNPPQQSLLGYFRDGDSTETATNVPNRFVDARRFRFLTDPNVDRSWLELVLHSPAELLVIDPLGRRVGLDPVTSTSYDEVPNAIYELSDELADDEGSSDVEEALKRIAIVQPEEGEYRIQVIGTGAGSYQVTRRFSDSKAKNIFSGTTIFGTTFPGQIDTYTFSFEKGMDLVVPKLAGFSVSPTTLDVTSSPGEVLVSFAGTDDVSGVDIASAVFESPSGGVSLVVEGNLVAGTSVNGTFQGTLNIPQGSETGTWVVKSVSLVDQAGNDTAFSTADLQASGFPVHLQVGSPEKQVSIDIKPGSFPNSINLNSNGTTPVAILSESDFDATKVDPSTVKLSGASVKKKNNGSYQATAEDANGDGIMDLVLHIITRDLQLTSLSTEAVLTGKTAGGLSITGTDSVNIVH
ncbi:MAG TPA: hypothetical protein VK465_17675 [Fibrobacteria bacterium]|nr:hypothetical protein [Fibrobacteria bacterium]